MKAFIMKHSKQLSLQDRLHAIWYCIPMDEECRSFTAGEKKFFLQCNTGRKLQSSVPVIVLFTKFDALYDIVFEQLEEEGILGKDATEQALKCAQESFANGPQLKFLKDVPWPPKHVCLPDMNKEGADCGPLIEHMAGTLDDEILTQLFVSTQQTNLELCMKYAVERTLSRLIDSAETMTKESHQKIIRELGSWFPHIEVVSVSILLQARAMLIQVITHWPGLKPWAEPDQAYLGQAQLSLEGGLVGLMARPEVCESQSWATKPWLSRLLCHPPRKAHGTANAAPSHIQTPTTVTASNEDDSDIDPLHSKPRRLTKGKKHAHVAANGNSELSAGAELEPDSLLNEAGPSATINPPQAPAIIDDERDADRFLKDVQVMDIDEPEKSRQEQQSRDINKKISAPYSDNKGKKYRHCVLCSKKTKKPVAFVNEVTTMRCHMEALHQH
ncbi:uncharacterized protein EDB93DRAFT_1104707 [Suillus bovinus]|uniref:uncharacterized protein n=1 Tax=Suillus bovinus TaxID=48563 RepID=UPI001B86BE39|nr:uncharacterized protein EDB93DRAFT_1104707 [Suillus bovinus]KAG2145457.1 hypothetical protein EDB93DRAFT_1104707 [Suillus bovinus]